MSMKYLWILLNINKGSSISLKRGGHFVASIKWHRAVLDNSWSGWGSAKKLFLLWWMLWSTVWHRHPVNAKDSLGAFLMLFLTAALWNSLPIQQFFLFFFYCQARIHFLSGLYNELASNSSLWKIWPIFQPPNIRLGSDF